MLQVDWADQVREATLKLQRFCISSVNVLVFVIGPLQILKNEYITFTSEIDKPIITKYTIIKTLKQRNIIIWHKINNTASYFPQSDEGEDTYDIYRKGNVIIKPVILFKYLQQHVLL